MQATKTGQSHGMIEKQMCNKDIRLRRNKRHPRRRSGIKKRKAEAHVALGQALLAMGRNEDAIAQAVGAREQFAQVPIACDFVHIVDLGNHYPKIMRCLKASLQREVLQQNSIL